MLLRVMWVTGSNLQLRKEGGTSNPRTDKTSLDSGSRREKG